MGFDLIAVRARAKADTSFHANCTGWGVITAYVFRHVDIPEVAKSGWAFNDGLKVSAKSARKIAATLRLLVHGEKAMPDDKEFLLEFAEFCGGSGGFLIY